MPWNLERREQPQAKTPWRPTDLVRNANREMPYTVTPRRGVELHCERRVGTTAPDYGACLTARLAAADYNPAESFVAVWKQGTDLPVSITSR
jgi:hypothetical protein